MHDLDRYDALMLAPHVRELFGGSGFYNVGDWSARPATLAGACRALVERHLRLLGTGARGRLLDVGCGLGAGTALIAEALPDARILGINLSIRQLAHAGGRCRYAAMDATELALASASVDSAIAVEAALHFPSRRRFLRELHRVLVPGGVAAVSDVYFSSPDWNGPWAFSPEPFDRATLVAALAECGFVLESIEDITEWTWSAFGDHLAATGLGELAGRVRGAGATYVLARLRR